MSELEETACPDWNESWVGTTIDPVKEAKHTPQPLHLPCPQTRWSDVLDDEAIQGRTLYIMGAGASALRQDLSLLDGELVYGINWTLKWFRPTFLQIVDQAVWMSQVSENSAWEEHRKEVQLVTSRWHVEKCKTNLWKHWSDALQIDIHHPGIASRQHDYYWAKRPSQKMTWYPNSLGWALNVAAWFKPSRIILLGFDFGGAHFFGDGRKERSTCTYGLTGNSSDHLIRSLRRCGEHLTESGIPVVQVGPTKLEDIFAKADTIQEALEIHV
jgi:hypothetical protein